jgi:hypothetical protein
VLSLEPDTETGKDAAEQLAMVQESLKNAAKDTLKDYTLQEQGLSLRYPNDWLAMTPQEVLKRARGNNLLTPACVLVIANPDNWDENLTIQITQVPGQGPVSREYLESLVPGVRQQMAGTLQDFQEVSHAVVDVAGVPALQFDCSSSAWGKRQRQRSIIFVKQEKIFTITCTAIEGDFGNADTKCFSPTVKTLKIETQ